LLRWKALPVNKMRDQIGLDLRDVAPRRLFIELDVDRRTRGLIDRRQAAAPAQVEVGNLILADRLCGRIDDDDDVLRLYGWWRPMRRRPRRKALTFSCEVRV